MAVYQVAFFHSAVFTPYDTAAGSVSAAAETDLQSQMNAFLATLNPIDVRDVEMSVNQVGKYGPTTWYYGKVIYIQH